MYVCVCVCVCCLNLVGTFGKCRNLWYVAGPSRGTQNYSVRIATAFWGRLRFYHFLDNLWHSHSFSYFQLDGFFPEAKVSAYLSLFFPFVAKP